MRKKLFTILLIAIAISFGTSRVEAAGKAKMYFSPAVKETKVGDSFTITVMIDPQGEKIDTARLVASYSHDKLAVIYFDFNGLFTAVAPGNYFDNQQGIISEGAAILGEQVTQAAVFGTITFKALSAGDAQITINKGSKIISSGQEKINIADSGSTTINIFSSEQEGMVENQPIVKNLATINQKEWQSTDKVNLSWSTAVDNVKNYFYAFDQNPDTDPTVKLDSKENSKEFEKVASGVWYFHLKAQYNDQTFSSVVHYPVMIDTIEPQKIEPIFEDANIIEGQDAVLKFATTDQPSGIDHYNVSLDGGEFSTKASPVIFRNLTPGNHIATVQAVDRAGNLVANIAEITVMSAPLTAPNTVNWQRYEAWAAIIVLLIVAVWWIIKRNKK